MKTALCSDSINDTVANRALTWLGLKPEMLLHDCSHYYSLQIMFLLSGGGGGGGVNIKAEHSEAAF